MSESLRLRGRRVWFGHSYLRIGSVAPMNITSLARARSRRCHHCRPSQLGHSARGCTCLYSYTLILSRNPPSLRGSFVVDHLHPGRLPQPHSSPPDTLNPRIIPTRGTAHPRRPPFHHHVPLMSPRRHHSLYIPLPILLILYCSSCSDPYPGVQL